MRLLPNCVPPIPKAFQITISPVRSKPGMLSKPLALSKGNGRQMQADTKMIICPIQKHIMEYFLLNLNQDKPP